MKKTVLLFVLLLFVLCNISFVYADEDTPLSTEMGRFQLLAVPKQEYANKASIYLLDTETGQVWLRTFSKKRQVFIELSIEDINIPSEAFWKAYNEENK